MKQHPNIIGLDIETSKKPNHLPWKDGHYISCISIEKPNNIKKTWFFAHESIPEYVDLSISIQEIQAEIDGCDFMAAHNAKFELNNLRSWLNIPAKKIFCTMVAEYLINYHSNKGLSLDALSPRYGLPNKIDKVKKMWEAGYDTYDIPAPTLQEYCEDDAHKARAIAGKQYYILLRRGLWKTFALQMEWLNVLSTMESNGILWDISQSHKFLAKYKRHLDVIERRIKEFTAPYCNGHDILLSSNDELSALLYGGVISRREKRPKIYTKNVKVQMPYVFIYKNGVKKIKKKWQQHPDTKCIKYVFRDVPYRLHGLAIKSPGKKSRTKKYTDERPYWTTDKNTLKFLKTTTRAQKVVIALLLKRSALYKAISSFYNEEKQTGLISKVGKDGKLHTNYNQTVTITGRLSSSDPNSQNLPRGGTSDIKKCIVPQNDGIMNADLSQVELRVPAQLAQDAVMIAEFTNGEDLHDNTRKYSMHLPKTKENRVHAKVFNFRMIYGGTAFGFHKDPAMPNYHISKWAEIINRWYERYKGIEQWQDTNISKVINGDGSLSIFTGRTFKFHRNPWGKFNEREIKNYPVQGCAGGDILPLAAVIIYKAMQKRNMKSKMLLTVHDSVVFDYIESEKKALATLCKQVFNNLPKYIKNYWGYNWVVPMKGDVEVGPNYGQLKEYM